MIETNKFVTTLRDIQAFRPYTNDWQKLLGAVNKTDADDEPVAMEAILDDGDLDLALWSLRAVDGIERETRLLACDFAEQALPVWDEDFPNDDRPERAIRVARLYAEGRATVRAVEAASDAAWCAAQDATFAGRHAASEAASAAAQAADHASENPLWETEWDAAYWAAEFAARAAYSATAWSAAPDADLTGWLDAACAADQAARAWQEARMRQMIRGEIYQQGVTS